ncbi:uncharacterized protein LOC141723918 isoform X2 [Apium graveolens]|uniref:uncharacterized protein LOC141723918 isoform X2 n=1 Tax=Apium graveolens TaxID=4045 RepID=UPI003D799E80
MFGASGKSGRGGRGGASSGGKRKLHSNFHSASLNRPSGRRPSTAATAAGSSAPRNNCKTTTTPPSPAASAPSAAVEESFSLETGNPLDFAMIIRLTPDLVDEIKRVEAQGGSARIKFDANAKNTSGNVIDVGGKDFRFTWSREMGDLCDIYEERQSGEDGNGLLVESGCAWRKLNVQRVLDESTKNHVKMRSEEAERKSKSRQAIILDHGNPSMKNQMKALAAAEANSWKMPFKQKIEPPYKKRKAEPPPASKGRTSASPRPSTPERPPASASPLGHSSLTKGHESVEYNVATQATGKEKASSSEKGTPSRVATTALPDKPVRKGNLGVKPTDLRSMLISLLTENPRGMSLKALEKSVGEYFPNSGRQIEPIIRKIATYQAPGRYILKSEAELESLKKPVSRSSPEINQPPPVFGNDRGDACDPSNSASPKSHAQTEEPVNLNSEPGEVVTVSEKNDIPPQSPDHYAEEKVPENSEGLVATSSDSGSDSDSESDSSDSESDSGSHSRGRSKSRSPIGSASGSSSDSESDASSNSKEGSDVEVDIMTSDDDKEPKDKLQAPGPELPTSPIPWRADGLLGQNMPDEMEDFHASEVVEIMENSPAYAHKSEIDPSNGSLPSKEGEKHEPTIKASSGNSSVLPESRVYTENLHRGRDKTARDGFRHEQSDRYQRKSEGKSKRRSDGKRSDNYAAHSEKVKAGSVTEAPMSEDTNFLFSRSPGKCSPDRPIDGPYKALHTHIIPKAAKDRADFGVHRTYNQSNPGKTISDSQLSGPRPVDTSGRTKGSSANDRPGVYAENLGSNAKSTERSLQMPAGLPVHKEKVNRDIQIEDGYNNEKRPPKKPREGAVDKNLTPTDSNIRKRGEFSGKMKEVGSLPNSHVAYPSNGGNRSDMDRSPIINERGPILRREPSELELGELRDPLPEETPGVAKQFDRKGSFKQSENKLTSFDYWNPDVSKGKPAGRTGLDPMKPLPPNSDIGAVGNLKGSSKKRSPGYYEDSTKPQHKVGQSHPPQLPRGNQVEVGSQLTGLADVKTESKWNEPVAFQGIAPEGFGDTQRKVPVVTEQPHDAVHGKPHSAKGSKRRKTDLSADMSEKCKDPWLVDGHAGEKQKRNSFSNDNKFAYSKYEKDEPELKGPIKDHSQYKEYVQEYEEKHVSYLSINKILESERNEFLKYGRDLEAAKGRDVTKYNSIAEQIKKSYSQCGARHKRLKNVFVVLHKELENLKEMIKDYAASYTQD